MSEVSGAWSHPASLEERTFDVVVVGSGAAGGWAAKQLGEAGLAVLLLEAGPLFPDSRKPRWNPEIEFRAGRQPIQRACYALREHSWHLFVDDIDLPYTTPEDKPFSWIRTRVLGGKMTLWAGLALRMSDLDFHAASVDGNGTDWPLRYDDLAPHYDEVERALRVTGEADGISHLPDGRFVDPLKVDAFGAFLRQRVRARWDDRQVISGRYALAPHDEILSDAVATGNVVIRPDAIAAHIELDASGRADHLVYVDRRTKRRHKAKGRAFVLAASPIESVRILLASRGSRHPNGLGNSSGTLGRFLMDHTFSVSVDARVAASVVGAPSEEVSPCMIPRFTNLKTRESEFVRGYGVQVRRTPGPIVSDSTTVRFLALGEMVPRPENRVSLSTAEDAWGLAVPHIECRYSENEIAMARHQISFLRELAASSGMQILRESSTLAPPGTSMHELGGARMGTDPGTSVLDPYSRCWDAPNVVVADGASFPSGGCQNPTLTIMAVAGRACAKLADDLRGTSDS